MRKCASYEPTETKPKPKARVADTVGRSLQLSLYSVFSTAGNYFSLAL